MDHLEVQTKCHQARSRVIVEGEIVSLLALTCESTGFSLQLESSMHLSQCINLPG